MSCKSNPSNVCCGGKCATTISNNLLLWKDAKKSGITLLSILSFLLLIKYVNLISLFFRLSTFLLLISAIAEYTGKILTGTGFVTKFKPEKYKFSIGKIADYYAPHFVTILKKIEIKVEDLYTSVDIESTLKFGGISFLLYKLTSTFSIWSLIFFSTILSFSVPPIYLSNKEIIDKNIIKIVDLSKVKINETYKIVDEKFGPQINKIKDSTAPVLKLIQSKLPVRTAGTTVGETTKEPISVATTSSAVPNSTSASSKIPSTTTPEVSEVDFNALGEKLKQEAQEATANASIYTREKVDAPKSL
ncbi:hypothetical protein C6P40_001267 [Pichia californica]|uniref:Reticulon-like protein n=1 Tax=Pichia californica TaxID=460514 RepID=A0A9P6WJC3_9ASCO|nr:hypothetical protein C6P42_001329 [[Candida] californica]KAG0688215.1 hypothetical protein C6P40_001267 [[Candida] californica]